MKKLKEKIISYKERTAYNGHIWKRPVINKKKLIKYLEELEDRIFKLENNKTKD